MITQGTILALFQNAADETLSSPLLAGIPNVIRAMASAKLPTSLENLKRVGIEPSLTILTGRLYAGERSGLVQTIRNSFPATEILLLSSDVDPYPDMRPLAADRVRHLTINPVAGAGTGEEPRTGFLTAIRNLVTGRPWNIADYVKAGTPLQEYAVASSAQKEELISQVEAAIPGDSADSDQLRQRVALLADEMLENALYGAPAGADGGKLYRKGVERATLPEERIVFRFAFDGDTLAMEVADGWGSLSPDLVLDYLAKNQTGDQLADDTGGRGLFIIWRFLDHFHVSITPGRETVVGGHIRASLPLDPDAPRGFHISTH
jgi:hypothetical protein